MFDKLHKTIPLHFAVVIVALVMIHDVDRCSAQLPTPSGVAFIGIGYNILYGNPEGGESGSGGVDPGLLVSRRIFDLTYEENKLSNDRQYQVPDEVSFVHRSSAYKSTSRTTFYGTSSYASKLSSQVDVSGSYNGLFASVEFAASTRYENIKSRTNGNGHVFFATETIRNMGQARYLDELAYNDGYGLENGFVSDACNLPSSYAGNEDNYQTFLDDWGTHVVTEVDLGTREGENYEENRSSFVTYASRHVGASVSVSGSYGAYSGSLKVNMESFTSNLETGESFGSEYSSYTVGSDSLNEPIKITLIGMHEIFEEKFWTQLSTYVANGYCTNSFNRQTIGANVLAAMSDYAERKSIEASSNPSIIIPLTWPEGTYGLPKPITGCPNTEFTWTEGYRKHDTEDDDSNNYWSDKFSLAGWKGRNNMQMEFCIKTTETVSQHATWTWQPGSYCIFKRGDCPSGFEVGYIYYDDEDSKNSNREGGTLPDGDYGRNTRYYFCCRDDGVVNTKIYLPTDDNFILFPRYGNNDGGNCQQVHGMDVQDQWFRWDNEDSNNRDAVSQPVPYKGLQSGGHNVILHFCYYHRPKPTYHGPIFPDGFRRPWDL